MKLTKTQWWLKEHQVIAFWHGFGLSNGLEVPQEETKKIYTTASGKYVDSPARGGKVYIKINKDYMLKLLKEYTHWLISYKENWESSKFDDTEVSNEEEYIATIQYPAELEIYKMIKLLQDDETINDYNSLLKEIEDIKGQQIHLKD